MLYILLLATLVGVPVEALEAEPSPAAPAPAASDSGHEVVQANTLWDLAGRYCKDPWQWPRIHAANRDKIKDPHWIYPGQVFVIPCTGKTVAVYPTGTPLPAPPPPPPAPEPPAVPVPAAPAAPPPEPIDDLSVEMPGGMTEQRPSVKRLMLPRGWKAEGRVVELEGREVMASAGDQVHVSLDRQAGKGDRYEVLRMASAMELDEDQKATYVQRIGVLEVVRKLSRREFQAVILKSGGTVQLGDLLRRAP